MTPLATIREVLSDTATGANSPFLRGEAAFSGIDNSGWVPSRSVFVAEEGYIASAEKVERTGQFAFTARAVAAVGGERGEYSKDHDVLEGFGHLEEERKTGNEGKRKTDRITPLDSGYRRLRRHANHRIEMIRSDLFVQIAEETLKNAVGTGRALVRLGPLPLSVHRRIGYLIENNFLDVAAGIDTSQPDLAERALYSFIDQVPRGAEGNSSALICNTDVQVTRALRLGERTGLFWRFEGRWSKDSGYEVGSCYVRLRFGEFPPIRIDVMARKDDLLRQVGRFVSYLNNSVAPLPENDRLFTDFESMLGGENVFVPTEFRPVLQALAARRQDTELVRYYEKVYAEQGIRPRS